MIRAAHNRFGCRFHNQNDQERVEEQQPWSVLGFLVLIQPFSTEMVTENVLFNTLPLWMSFKGLELEHLHANTVKMIGSAAGEVTTVMPTGIIPRTAEGFRARVNVDIHRPLVQGWPVTTLAKGVVWISFKYNNLPGLFCHLCLRLGHTRNHCRFPPSTDQPSQRQTTNQTTEAPTPPTTQVTPMITWPHEFNNSPATTGTGQSSKRNTNMGLSEKIGPNGQNTQLLQTWADIGLLSDEEKNDYGPQNTTMASEEHIQLGPSKNTDPNDQEYGSPIRLTQPVSNEVITHISPKSRNTQNEGRQNTPLKIHDNSDEVATTRRGRGRPPGSVNKPKGSTDLKGKGKLVTEDTKEKPIKGKKRKIVADSLSFGVSYIPDPPEIKISPTDDRHNHNNNNSEETLDLISQMRANPTLTNLLFQRGTINPKVIQTSTTLLSEPPSTNSNWNTSSPTHHCAWNPPEQYRSSTTSDHLKQPI
ncbi:hypothetical protein FRX31_010427 [Thalictrum thalictroides]|uniref:DUF4283 domain-containing protein n=1 Tax=Thalictrum thalictroides TaxID=46969 RepID=A0A7J6WRH6_THATH|nr:hypothetical protein FRX31_010427 [Thalictrum thalictroides]